MVSVVVQHVDQIVHRLRLVPGLRFAALFGSAARGLARAGSDIDLAISVDHEARPDFDAQIALAATLTHAARRDVDLVVVEEAGTVLRHEVACGGRLLWEREPGTFARFRMAVSWEYEDFAPVLAVCRRGFLAAVARRGAGDGR